MFWSEKEQPYGCFSQWYTGATFDVDGQTYFCAEQFMMASKARLFEDEKALRDILRERHSPKRVKELGRGVSNFDAKIWSSAAYDVVVAGSYAKFKQNDHIRRVLLATAPAMLAEASPYDTIWGIGLRATDPDAANLTKWRGTNLLGKALMAVRDRLILENDPGACGQNHKEKQQQRRRNNNFFPWS